MKLSLCVLALLGLAAARRATAPTSFADAKKRAKSEIKTAVRANMLGARTGYDRLRGNALEAAGVATGSVLAFSGARYAKPALLLQSALVSERTLQAGLPKLKRNETLLTALVAGAVLAHVPAAAPLLASIIIGGVSARACEGLINATNLEEDRKARMRRALPPLVAIIAVAAAPAAAASLGVASTRTLASALLGSCLLVECSISHLRAELDQIIVACVTKVAPLLQGALMPLVRRLRAARRALLPLPKLVSNQLRLRTTATQSALSHAEAFYDRSPPRRRAALIMGIGAATQAPFVHGAATQAVAKAVNGQLESRFQSALPGVLREKNVTSRVALRAASIGVFNRTRAAWAAGRAALLRSWRSTLPLFVGVWGAAVQGGKLTLLCDAPRVLVWLFPLKWQDAVPEPMALLSRKTRALYRGLISSPVKRTARAAAAWAGALLAAPFRGPAADP